MREIPRPGDRRAVITKDNVVVTVNATIFTQIVDFKQARFSVASFDVAIDALARTALRTVIATMTRDEALSERNASTPMCGSGWKWSPTNGHPH